MAKQIELVFDMRDISEEQLYKGLGLLRERRPVPKVNLACI